MASNIGIDLGTTNSLVAVVIGGKARCLLDEAGRAMLPSAVRCSPSGEAIVGYDAREQAAAHPGRTFTSVKRLMGRAPQDCAADAALFRYQMDERDERVVRLAVRDAVGGVERWLTPVEISAEILRSLKARAAECLFGEPGGAVITVPAYFDDAQRQATRDAARLAGLEVLRLLNEPTAAAIAYGLDKRERGVFAVYDLGGGTFDISILELNDGIFQVLSTAGDTHLGGDDFDRAIAEALVPGLAGVSEAALREILLSVEAAKRRLSDADATTLSLQGQEHTLTRAQVEAAIAPILARTGAACQQALSDAKLTPSQIEAVVLVGGSTRVPAVRAFVERLFGRAPSCDLNPDEVVALGAAMQADILSGSSSLSDDLLLLDVIPLSLGLEIMGGVAEKFIPRCSTIPVSSSQTFTTHVDNQTTVGLHVVQGDRELASDCRSLARFTLRGLPPLPAGVPRIKVEFTVDADGLLKVSAREEHSGLEAKVEVKPSYGLTDEEMERMIEDSIENAETDIDVRQLIEAKVEAEGILAALEKALQHDADLLSPGEGEEIAAVEAALRASMEAGDRKRIADLSHRLDEVTAPFAQRRIERDLTRALSGRAAEDVGLDLGLASAQRSEGGVADV